ncbi:M20/M25/M40 family metallo-hydrolase [Lysinibacter cavernae]|uniref:Hippurate hydrolase n=1 Tax=Lysinibacter cavernae TaxID=1640652 RepID=A0A7X5R3N5_9MICO|nr:M20/M25/M40 family metallo-hydrolase [Lysinibacter cavernae]NIH55068.1 hippurate hydrolase [Lysinibacter cavernae]
MPPIPVMPLTAGLEERMVALRRTLHRNPEVGLYAPQAQMGVINALRGLPLDVAKARGSSSVVAILRATPKRGQPVRAPIVHRALMGATPIEERTAELFAARNGAMHAAGADLQTAALVGAISHLCEAEIPLPGDVMCVFQAGEPGQGAIESLLDEGLLDFLDEAPAVAYGTRFEAEAATGTHLIHEGQATADVASFCITVYRYGSPFDQISVDSQRVAALIVRALYDCVGSLNYARDVRLVAGVVNSSFSIGVQPSETTLLVTCASIDAQQHSHIVQDLGRVALTVAAAENALAVIGDIENISAVYNDAGAVHLWSETASAFAADGRCHHLERPAVLADDLSLLFPGTPLAIGFFGAASPVAHNTLPPGLNSAATVFDDRVIANVAAFLSTLSRASLGRETASGTAVNRHS